MCRGANGVHETLMDGVSYCRASGTLHVDLCRAAEHFGFNPSDGIVQPFTITSRLADWLARYMPSIPVRFWIVGVSTTGKRGACHE